MRPANILLVEDDDNDAKLTQLALVKSKVANRMYIVPNGQEALCFLRKEGEYRFAPTPDLILLDLNMPIMDGREFLSIIKQDKQFLRIPVVVLTTSSAKPDIRESYDMHVNCFITKPVEFQQFMGVISTLDQFWFGVVSLPGIALSPENQQ